MLKGLVDRISRENSTIFSLFFQATMVEKFAAKNPSCIEYDEKLQFYSNLANEVSSTK